MTTIPKLPLLHLIAIWSGTATASISVLSSMTIVYMMLSDREYKLKKPNNRLLLAMSLIDTFQSLFGIALGTIPQPEGTNYNALGNDMTCSIQGFFMQLGLAVPCYNASLCIWYLMSITYNIHPNDFRVKYERYLHLISLLLPLVTATVMASLGILAPRGYVCWIGEDKPYATPFVFLSGGIVGVSNVIVIFCLGKIYYSVLVLERKMQSYTRSPSGMQWRPNANLHFKKKATRQISWFSIAFVVTFLFPTINTFFYSTVNMEDVRTSGANFPFLLPQAICFPLQGFWNFVIYIRPSLERIRTEYPELPFHVAFFKMIFSPDQVRPMSRARRRSSAAMRRNIQSLESGVRRSSTTAGATNGLHSPNNNVEPSLNHPGGGGQGASIKEAKEDIEMYSDSFYETGEQTHGTIKQHDRPSRSHSVTV